MVIRSLRRLGIASCFVAAFVINPGYVVGCGSTQDDAANLAAMEAQLVENLDALNGTAAWEFVQDGVRYELLLALSQQQGDDRSARAAPAPRMLPVAHACGTHTFYQSASACGTTYELALEGTLTLRRLGDDPATIAADVPVQGHLTNVGFLWLDFADTDSLMIEHSWDDPTDSWIISFGVTDLGDDRLSFDYRG